MIKTHCCWLISNNILHKVILILYLYLHLPFTFCSVVNINMISWPLSFIFWCYKSLCSYIQAFIWSLDTLSFCHGDLIGNILVRRLTLEEVGDVVELRDVVLTVAAVPLQQRENAVVLAARVSGIQGLQLPEHSSPCDLLLLRVLHTRDRLTTADRERKAGEMEWTIKSPHKSIPHQIKDL